MIWVPEDVVAPPDAIKLPAAALQHAHRLPAASPPAAAASGRNGDALDLDRARNRIAVWLERFEVELDRLADHRERFLSGRTLADAAGQRRNRDAVAASLLGRQHHLVFTRRHAL